jgi:hypothetical protein
VGLAENPSHALNDYTIIRRRFIQTSLISVMETALQMEPQTGFNALFFCSGRSRLLKDSHSDNPHQFYHLLTYLPLPMLSKSSFNTPKPFFTGSSRQTEEEVLVKYQGEAPNPCFSEESVQPSSQRRGVNREADTNQTNLIDNTALLRSSVQNVSIYSGH